MRNYTASRPEETESYAQYKNRRTEGLRSKQMEILRDIRNSSLKPNDKKKVMQGLIKDLSNEISNLGNFA